MALTYKNGREAKTGDKVVSPNLSVGTLIILCDKMDNYNARLQVAFNYLPYVTVNECLHIDDTEFKE